MNFSLVLSALDAAGIRFVVVGGVAAGIHGSSHVTIDLDICYDPAPDNVERLAHLLAEWDAYPRGIEPGPPFIMDARTFRTTPFMTLTTVHGPLDVMDAVAGVGDYSAVARQSTEIEVGGAKLRFLTLPALIAAKRAARRRKDLDQLPELEALLAMSKRGSRRGH